MVLISLLVVRGPYSKRYFPSFKAWQRRFQSSCDTSTPTIAKEAKEITHASSPYARSSPSSVGLINGCGAGRVRHVLLVRLDPLPSAQERGVRQGRHGRQGLVLVGARHRGTVLEVEMSRSRDPIVVVHVVSKVLRIGDKLGTMPGLKFTVGGAAPVRHHRLVGGAGGRDAQHHRRGDWQGVQAEYAHQHEEPGKGAWGGQIREMAAVTNMFDSIEAFRTKEMHQSRKAVVVSFEDQKRVGPRLEGGRGLTREEVNVHGHQQEGEDGQGHVRDYTCTTAQIHYYDQTLPVHGI
ncbi:hypothetical protein FOPE_10596 [Fonsecaea pedrosoi]|nr:hypothetical protein FOPE_10596 [Fonsecaea pedrosoi]